jgi:hypothetical protein
MVEARLLGKIEGETGPVKKPLNKALLEIEAREVVARGKRSAHWHGAGRSRTGGSSIT